MRGEVVEIEKITDAEKDQMFELLEAYFEGIDRNIFESDLADKQWAVMLRDDVNIFGFSTLCLLEDTVQGHQIKAFFSGDTIISREHWGSMVLENTWAKFVFSKVKSDPVSRWYWFLICKGYRTYRYLPVYFRNYYPGPHQVLGSFERTVLNLLATKRFGCHYCAKTGTVHIPNDCRLRAGVGDITDKELRDPRITFFQDHNPDWQQGIELVCIAELNLDNLKKAASRFLKENQLQ